MVTLVDKIIVPYCEATKVSLGLVSEQPSIVILDQYSVHTEERFKDYLRARNLIPIYVPACLTGELQPADILLNKIVKDSLRRQYHQWLTSEFMKLFAVHGANAPQVDTRMSVIKPIHCSWVTQAYSELKNRSDVILRSWGKAGIKIDIVLIPEEFESSHEDDEVWEPASDVLELLSGPTTAITPTPTGTPVPMITPTSAITSNSALTPTNALEPVVVEDYLNRLGIENAKSSAHSTEDRWCVVGSLPLKIADLDVLKDHIQAAQVLLKEAKPLLDGLNTTLRSSAAGHEAMSSQGWFVMHEIIITYYLYTFRCSSYLC